MNSKLLLALLLCAVLVPSVWAATADTAAVTKAQWQTRLLAATSAVKSLKTNTLANARLVKMNVASTTNAVNALTDEQLAQAVQSKVAANFPAWKQKLTELKATPSMVSPAALRVIKERVVNAYAAKNWKDLDSYLAKYPELSSACETEISAVKALASEAASTATVLVQDVTDVTAADETAVPTTVDATTGLVAIKEARQNLVSCIAKQRLDSALANHTERVTNRIALHKQFATKIDRALSQLDSLSSARVSQGLPAIPEIFKTTLEKLKAVNNQFIEKGSALLAENPGTPKEKLLLVQRMNNFNAASIKFQNTVRQLLQKFVKWYTDYRSPSPVAVEITSDQSDATTVTTTIDQAQTVLVATVEELPQLPDTDPVVQVATTTSASAEVTA
jgi:hypothetical protein